MHLYLPLLFTALIAANTTAHAQYNGPKASLEPSLAKTTETKRRIIAEAKYDYSATEGYLKTDSTKLEWFGGMGHYRFPSIMPYFTYDKAASNERHHAELPGPIQPYTKTQKIYNSNNEVTYEASYIWNSGTWDSVSRTIYTYIGGKLVLDETQKKMGSRGWLNRTKNVYTYKAGLLDEVISYTYRSIFLNDLKYYSKTNYSYASGIIDNITTALWDSSGSVSPAFYNKSRLYLVFSGKDTTQKTTQSWNNTKGDWQNVERKSYNFAKGPYSEDLTERWNTTISAWQNYAKDSLVYTGGLLVNHILFEWDNSSKSWGATQVYAFGYTGTTLTEARQLQWDGTKWVDDYLTQYHYDAYNDISKALLFKWDGAAFKPATYTAATYYYYEEYTPTALPNTAPVTAKVNLYPNPAVNRHCYLDFFADQATPYDIRVVDLMGREVYRHTEEGFRGDHSALLQLDQMTPGVYLVNLSCAGQLQAQLKLVR